MKNRNCLENLRCPECGNEFSFKIAASAWFTVTDDGTDDPEEVEWGDDSPARCTGCEWRGTVSQMIEVDLAGLPADRGILVRPDGVVLEVQPSKTNPPRFTLSDVQDAVGGYVEVLPLPRVPGTHMALGDEEGKLKRKDPNPKVERILGTMAQAGGMAGDVIVGNVLIVPKNTFE